MGRPKDGSANQIKGACGYEEECKKSRMIQKKGICWENGEIMTELSKMRKRKNEKKKTKGAKSFQLYKIKHFETKI